MGKTGRRWPRARGRGAAREGFIVPPRPLPLARGAAAGATDQQARQPAASAGAPSRTRERSQRAGPSRCQWSGSSRRPCLAADCDDSCLGAGPGYYVDSEDSDNSEDWEEEMEEDHDGFCSYPSAAVEASGLALSAVLPVRQKSPSPDAYVPFERRRHSVETYRNWPEVGCKDCFVMGPYDEVCDKCLTAAYQYARRVGISPPRTPNLDTELEMALEMEAAFREGHEEHEETWPKKEVPAADDCVHFQRATSSENDGGNSDSFITSVSRVDDPVASIDLCEVKEHELSPKRCGRHMLGVRFVQGALV